MGVGAERNPPPPCAFLRGYAGRKGARMMGSLFKCAAVLALLSAPASAFAAYVAPGPADIAAELAYRQMANNYTSALRQCEPGTHSESNVQSFRCMADR